VALLGATVPVKVTEPPTVEVVLLVMIVTESRTPRNSWRVWRSSAVRTA